MRYFIHIIVHIIITNIQNKEPFILFKIYKVNEKKMNLNQ